jgi:hypothetical protein
LKLYFSGLQDRVVGFGFGDEKSKKKAFKDGFMGAYKDVLGYILDTDWSDCPADFKIIEQVVLARNCGQHGSDLTSFRVSHDNHTLDKHPLPFFVNEHERELWMRENGTGYCGFLTPSVEVTRELLFAAIEHVEMLAYWIEGRMDKAADWRMSRR